MIKHKETNWEKLTVLIIRVNKRNATTPNGTPKNSQIHIDRIMKCIRPKMETDRMENLPHWTLSTHECGLKIRKSSVVAKTVGATLVWTRIFTQFKILPDYSVNIKEN